MWVILLLFLGACNPFGAFKPTSDEILAKNWAPDPYDSRKNKSNKQNLYCYKTLGENMCYAKKIKDQQSHSNRFVGQDNLAQKQEQEPFYSRWLPYPIR